MSIREARLDDASAIARVHAQSRAVYYGAALSAEDATADREPMWCRFLADDTRFTVVADGTSGVIGFLSAHQESTGGWDLTSLYVLPAVFGTGVADQLYRTFVERIGTAAAALEVWDENLRAQAFYRRRGWLSTDAVRPGPGAVPFRTWHLRRDEAGSSLPPSR